jgi:hypothetical protein
VEEVHTLVVEEVHTLVVEEVHTLVVEEVHTLVVEATPKQNHSTQALEEVEVPEASEALHTEEAVAEHHTAAEEEA